ncbi:hypothetical protein ACNFR7_04880 [Streptomyces sp. RM1]
MEPCAGGLGRVDAAGQVADDRQADLVGLGDGGEEDFGADQADLDEVRPLLLLPRDLARSGLDGAGVERGQHAARHHQQGGGVGAERQCAGAALGQQLGRAGHLTDAGDAVGEHERERTGRGVGADRVDVHVVVAGHGEHAGGVHSAGGRVGWPLGDGLDGGDAPALDENAPLGGAGAVVGVDDGHVVDAQAGGAHWTPLMRRTAKPPSTVKIALTAKRLA